MVLMGEKPLTDIELEHLARMGDASAFGRLIRGMDSDLRGVVWNVVRSQSAIDDVMQRSYEKAFMAVGDFKHQSSMKTWLHSICYRTAIDYVRSEKIRTHEDFDLVSEDQMPDVGRSQTESVAERGLVKVLLSELDPDTRAMLFYTSGLGYTFDETADVLGVERGTVASRVSRAKARLRQIAGDQNE